MATLSNVDPVTHPNQSGFKGRIKPTGTTKREDKHQLGSKNAPKDSIPEFHAHTVPPNTAPRESTYTANMENKFGDQALNPDVERSHGKESTKTTASSTIRGATSQDVNRGLGHPGVGQTKNEIRHEGQHGRKHQGSGLEGVGTNRPERFERTLADQRGIDREGVYGGEHSDKRSVATADVPPQSADRAHHKYQPRDQPSSNNRS
ncbi:hypothetical protein PHISP_00180 [Aspergillus sp. HF37]|nr:hypothetical protein PHISP_00180 [Aspergillus sp. HF37]